MNKEKIIKKTIKEFFKKMTLSQEPENLKIDNNVVSFEIKTEAPEDLIGRGGQILADIERLLARIISKKTEEKFFVNLDINQYKKKKIEYLEEMAKESADEALLTKKEKILPPMNSFERRIIHLALSEKSGVSVESRGEEPERRIVIKPKSIINN